jgi:uncharacterized protein (TIGR02284 family)
MDIRVADAAQQMKSETVESLQDLVRALQDSAQYHNEAADKIENDDYVTNTLRKIATERKQICENIGEFIEMADETPVKDGTFMGKMRTIWTAFRAGLNAGNPTVVLIEAERAEDVIVNKFKSILPDIAGNPWNDKLNEHFETVKNGHDRVLALRNAYQAK